MKKNLILFGALTMLAFASCNNKTETKEPVESTPAPAPAASEETKTVVVDPPSQKEGTTIKMNENGVSVENKDGSTKNNVKISGDSTSVEISRPK